MLNGVAGSSLCLVSVETFPTFDLSAIAYHGLLAATWMNQLRQCCGTETHIVYSSDAERADRPKKVPGYTREQRELAQRKANVVPTQPTQAAADMDRDEINPDSRPPRKLQQRARKLLRRQERLSDIPQQLEHTQDGWASWLAWLHSVESTSYRGWAVCQTLACLALFS